MPPATEVPGLRTLARHALPHLLEATIIPTAVFYVALWLTGVWGALVAGLVWSYGAVVRRVVTGRRVPGVLVLGALGLTVRTALALTSGSVVVYFLQPTLGTVVAAVAFLVSVATGKPLAARLVADFVPLPAHVLERVWARRFFARVSVAWGVVQLFNAGVTLWLLLTQPLATYVAAKTVVSMAASGTLVVVATVVFRRLLARDGAVRPCPALAPGPLAAVKPAVSVPAFALAA